LVITRSGTSVAIDGGMTVDLEVVSDGLQAVIKTEATNKLNIEGLKKVITTPFLSG